MKTALIALAASLAAAAAVRDPKPSTYTDGQYGFSLQAPAFAKAEGGSITPVMLLGPAEDGFAPNVNVVVQNEAGTLVDYAATTRKELQEAKFKLLSETPGKVSGKDSITWEYEGSVQGRELRWLARGVSVKGRITLVTYTALRKNYEKVEKAFRDSLESFKLDE